MTYPKIKPCPECSRSGEDLDIYTYPSGWKYVECVRCNYRGPGEGTFRDAIRSHNKRVEEINCDVAIAKAAP